MRIEVQFDSIEEMIGFADQLAQGLNPLTDSKTSKVKAENKDPVPSESETSMNNAPVGIEEEEKSSEDNKHTSLTLEDVRKMFVEKNSIRGNTTKLKAILKEFKVAKVTDLEVKDFEAVMQKLEEV